MRIRPLTIVALCVMAAIATGQVRIREKVTITPRSDSTAIVQAPLQIEASPMRAVFSVNGPIGLRLYVSRDCSTAVNGGEPFVGSEQLVYGIPETVIGPYVFDAQVRVADIPIGDSVKATFTLFAGQDVVYGTERTYQGGGTDVYVPWLPKEEFVPYAASFMAYPFEGCLREGESTTFASYLQAYCSQEIQWSPECDLIEFRITTGTELGQLRNRSGVPLGERFVMKWEEAQGMQFVANPSILHGGVVRLEASVRAISIFSEINVYREGEYALALESYGSSLQHGEALEVVGIAVACAGVPTTPPEGTTYSFSISKGTRWARLYDEETDSTGDELHAPARYDGTARMWLQAWGDVPEDAETVVVELRAGDKTADPLTFEVLPGGLKITVDPDTMTYGEKTSIIVERQLPDGTIEPFGPEAQIWYTVVSATGAGILHNADSSEVGDFLVQPGGVPLRFSAAEEEPQADTVEVLIKVETWGDIMPARVLGAEGRPSPRKGLPALSAIGGTAQGMNVFGSGMMTGMARITVAKERFEIMLGESKYYYVVEKDGRLRIRETKSPELPDEEGIVKSASVWANVPVTVVGVEPNSGRRLGVYWETEKPKPTGTGDLPPGLIRLLGRYWVDDSVYKVKLAGKMGLLNEDVTIDVIRPTRLGSTHNTTTDVNGDSFNLDSVVISYSGRFGIPPQFIKGDIQKESWQFNPSYRWEPFYDCWHLYSNGGNKGTSPYLRTNYRYKVKSASEVGTPEIPTDHSNVKPISYPGYAGTIWEEFFQYADASVNPQAATILYRKYTLSGTDTSFVWYKTPARGWDKVFKNTKARLRRNELLTDTLVREGARRAANDWLKDEWLGGIMGKAVAQTRSAASYGLLQIMYTTAHDLRNYPVDASHPPEFLNLTDTIFTYALPYLWQQVESEVGSLADRSGNWTNGLEETYLRAFNRYNGANEEEEIKNRLYGRDVMQFARNYLPRGN